jgi:Family of unknown function (DUF6356)
MFHRFFLARPRSVGESYFAHQRVALYFAAQCLRAGGACLIHALVPALFPCTASRTIGLLHERMIVKRRIALATEFPAPPTAVDAAEKRQQVFH